MKFTNTRIFVLVLLLSSCSLNKDVEESVLIYDPIKNKAFIKLLDEKKVNYRIQDDGIIFYPKKQSELAKAAFEQATGKKIRELQPAQ